MAERKGLVYFSWYFDTVALYRERLSDAEMGELFFAVMLYAEKGERSEVSTAISWPYEELCRRADASKKSYEKKCETLAKNGTKGGTAKAKNAKKEAGFSPPTKSEFKEMADHFKKKDEISFEPYDLTTFYEQLREDNWCISGIPIKNRRELESVLISKFYVSPHINKFMDWTVFRHMTKKLGFISEESISEFFDFYSRKTESWKIGGVEFEVKDFSDAIDAFLENYSNNS